MRSKMLLNTLESRLAGATPGAPNKRERCAPACYPLCRIFWNTDLPGATLPECRSSIRPLHPGVQDLQLQMQMLMQVEL